MPEFRAHSKLLLFGEYFVLDGCTALAWPLRFGQQLRLETEPSLLPGLHWQSYDYRNKLWFEAFFDQHLLVQQSMDAQVATTLQKILLAARERNKNFLSGEEYHTARIYADYPSEWGLGSSSTLIHLIAQSAGIDPMELFFASFTGSGYDVACAGASGPIVYRLREGKAEWEEIHFPPGALSGGCFVYLGRKQDSREGIARYREFHHQAGQVLLELDTLVRDLLVHTERHRILAAMEQSETLIGNALQLPPVKTSHFPDFPGSIKSLGAWGGDFIWAMPREPEYAAAAYFRSKGYETMLGPEEILLGES